MAGSTSFIRVAQRLIAGTSLLLAVSAAQGAEVTGTVTVDYQGLFAVDTSVRNYPVSVALFPGQGQRITRRKPRTHRVDIIENRMQPVFMAIQQGDRVTFVNHDAVFHQLFSLSSSEPLSLQLGRSLPLSGIASAIRPYTVARSWP